MADVELNGRSGWLTIRSGKGNETRRVPLNSEARQAPQAWLEVCPQAQTKAVFLSRSGRLLDERDVQRMVAEYTRIAGVDASPHTLLEHSRLETTRRYLHPTAGQMREAVEGV